MRCGYCDDEMTDDTILEHVGQACVKRLQKDLAAERIENVRLREAFMVMERGYNLAAAVLDGAEVFSERQPLVCTDDGIIEDPSQLAIVVDRAAWQAWMGRQT